MKKLFTLSICLILEAFSSPRPNIVLVMSDDHGYGDCGYTGHPFVQTPHLDDMAKSGVVFNRFYASAPVCSPTRASVLTGRNPFRVNVPNHGHYLRPHETTIAEKLKEAGYLTGHFGKWHIGSVQPNSPTSPGGAGFDEWLSGLNFFDNNPFLSRNGKYLQIKGAGTVITMDATLAFLEKYHQGPKPLFIVTWFPSPHAPHHEVPQGMPNASKLYNDQRTGMKGYFREITLLDQQMGRLRKKLQECNLTDNTLLFYCSDNGGLDRNGGPTENAPLRSGKGYCYEGGIRVPFLARWPGTIPAGKKTDFPVSSIDLFPTIMEATGTALPKDRPIDGLSLTNHLNSGGKESPKRETLIWHFPHYRHAPGPYSIIRKGDIKLIKFWEGIYELYDLKNDLGEANNLAESKPGMVKKLETELIARLKADGAKLPINNSEYKN